MSETTDIIAAFDQLEESNRHVARSACAFFNECREQGLERDESLTLCRDWLDHWLERLGDEA